VPKRKYTVLKPVHPNAGIEAEYRAKLLRLVREMQASYVYFLKAQYRETPPELALDADSVREAPAWNVPTGFTGVVYGPRRDQFWAYVEGEMLRGARGSGRIFKSTESAAQALRKSHAPRISATPARALERELSTLGKRWQKRIDEAAPKLARWFTLAAHRRSQDSLKKILKDGGISVEFKMTAPMRDVLDATLAENVSLIKSIGSQYHTEVEGMVMRSVTAGRDLQSLNKELKERYGVTERRANFIALDQNNKATSSFVRVRQQDLGLKAKWLHSHGGKEPRPTHLANDGNVYDPAVGWFDPDPKVRKRIWPGQLPRCRCVSVSVVPGFSLD
jgi:hypothetical protein